MRDQGPAVYILASARNGTFYIGVTSNLEQRIRQHRNGELPGCTLRYNIRRLVYFERWSFITVATEREKQLKKWNRAWKLELIESVNWEWRDLWSQAD